MNKLILLFLCLTLLANLSCNNRDQTNAKTVEISDIKKSAEPSVNNKLNYILKNDSINMYLSLIRENDKKIHFELHLENKNKSQNISGIADLILLEDENGNFYVPEGSFILDENANEDYLCDSTYSFISPEIEISIGLERESVKRLSLGIVRSQKDFIKDGHYTLYKVKG